MTSRSNRIRAGVPNLAKNEDLRRHARSATILIHAGATVVRRQPPIEFRHGREHIGASVIKLDLINEVVTKTGVTKTKAEMAVETVFESMKKALAHGDRIELRGFGVFNVRPRKTGMGGNPRPGAEVSIPPGKAVVFKRGKELQSID